jgi:hypothetical protein
MGNTYGDKEVYCQDDGSYADGDDLHGHCSHRTSTESDLPRALLDSMDTIYQQMVCSQIAYYCYNLVLDESIAEIPLNKSLEATYFQAPTITQMISHFQNDDEARNMTRFTMAELRRLLLLFDLPVKISINKDYTLHR